MKIMLKETFKMSEDEKAYLQSLPANLPDTKIKEQDKDAIYKLYRKYVGNQIDNVDWSLSLMAIEKKESWPSGHRTKDHEAQRMILNWLVGFRSEIEAQMVLDSLTNRESYRKLLKAAYQIVA